MSEDADLESDPPVSRHALIEIKDDINLDEPLSVHIALTKLLTTN